MKPSSCARLFEVEALRDGRLSGPERERFEKHLAACPSCAREAASLEALAGMFRAPDDAIDQLHVRRERNRLLAAFDRELVPRESEPARGRSVHRSLVVLAAASALAAGVLTFWRAPSERPTGATSAAVLVQADESARYTKHTEGTRDTIVLERGVLRIQVQHAAGAHSLLVMLPDGELEDTGTTFTVTASDGRTTHVAVEEGSVVLRLSGEAPIAIAAGQTWSPGPPAPPASAPVPAVSALAPLPLPSRTPARSDAFEEFRAAMAAFDSGDSAGAEARFARFVAKHPDDSRAEDAAYLRVIALQRIGDDGRRRSAAKEYLLRYPSGFRRVEVERLSR